MSLLVMKNVYIAGGCFWCVSSVFTSLDGVKDVISGFSGGDEINPSYQEVKSQQTGHRETIKVIYDETKLNEVDILNIFFDNVDPFDGDGQFIDRGHSYTLAIYYQDEEEHELVKSWLLDKSNLYSEEIKIAIEEFKAFYDAEEYHQRFSEKHKEEFLEELKTSGRMKDKN